MNLHVPALSDEIYLMILQELSNLSPPSLCNVCFVSRHLCSLATSILYRSVELPYGWSRDIVYDPLNIQYTFESNVIAHCRTLTVKEVVDVGILAKLLLQTKCLVQIRWRYWHIPFPAIIKDIIQNSLPHAQLLVEELRIGTRDDEEVEESDRTLLGSLVGIKNISSIKAEIYYEHPVAMRWLKNTLISSKNLNILHITLPRNSLGIAEWSNDALGAFDLCAEPGDQLLSLQELIYESRVAMDVLDSVPKTIPVSFFNWALIRYLTLRGQMMISLVMVLPAQHMNLIALTIEYFCLSEDFHQGSDVLENFVSRVHGLQSLTLVNPVRRLLASTIAMHKKLKTLNIRNPRHGSDPYSITYRPYSYLPPDLEIIRESCPRIQSLGFDIGFLQSMPYNVLAAIACFPELRTLRLFVYFAGSGRSRSQKGALPHYRSDMRTVRHAYSFLSSQKVGVAFDVVEFMLGDYRRNVGLGIKPSIYDRPNMLFSCREKNGEIIVDDDHHENEDTAWSSYFDDSRLESVAGETFPSNLAKILTTEEKAEIILESIEHGDLGR